MRNNLCHLILLFLFLFPIAYDECYADDGELMFGVSDEFVVIAQKEFDNFNLAFRYRIYYFALPVWISPQDYVLYYPEEEKYKSIGQILSLEVMKYYSLKSRTPKPSIGSRFFLYLYGLLAEVMLCVVLTAVNYKSILKFLRRYSL